MSPLRFDEGTESAEVETSELIGHLYIVVASLSWSYGSWYTNTYAIVAYHHLSCEFESRSCRGVFNTTLSDKSVSDMQQVGSFFRVLQFPPSITLTATI